MCAENGLRPGEQRGRGRGAGPGAVCVPAKLRRITSRFSVNPQNVPALDSRFQAPVAFLQGVKSVLFFMKTFEHTEKWKHFCREHPYIHHLYPAVVNVLLYLLYHI